MKIGFIGCGNMASAMIGGIIKSGKVGSDSIFGSDSYDKSLKKAKEAFGIHTMADNLSVAQAADVLVLSVKPQFYPAVISEIVSAVDMPKIVVTLAPGITLRTLEATFGKPVKIIRTMPNTPALVGAGMTGACANEHVTVDEMETVCELLKTFGKVEVVPEKTMDAVVAVSGSSPAYIFMLIEAMADAAVSEGMTRQTAYTFAAQAVMGSAKMVMETGRHPGELKDMVCSPGGTTIEAVRVLEEKGFRSAIIEGMKACAKKSKQFSKE